jgi:hypothetical protein
LVKAVDEEFGVGFCDVGGMCSIMFVRKWDTAEYGIAGSPPFAAAPA